jgi:hypothetical protein
MGREIFPELSIQQQKLIVWEARLRCDWTTKFKNGIRNKGLYFKN